jgi:hypothetical protein
MVGILFRDAIHDGIHKTRMKSNMVGKRKGNQGAIAKPEIAKNLPIERKD